APANTFRTCEFPSFPLTPSSTPPLHDDGPRSIPDITFPSGPTMGPPSGFGISNGEPSAAAGPTTASAVRSAARAGRFIPGESPPQMRFGMGKYQTQRKRKGQSTRQPFQAGDEPTKRQTRKYNVSDVHPSPRRSRER